MAAGITAIEVLEQMVMESGGQVTVEEFGQACLKLGLYDGYVRDWRKYCPYDGAAKVVTCRSKGKFDEITGQRLITLTGECSKRRFWHRDVRADLISGNERL